MKKLKIGVIGVGGIGWIHCKDVRCLKETELAGVCDIDEKVAERVGKEFKVEYFTDYKKLIRSGLCDAVIVATPHLVHPEISNFAFRNGLHVLCEKPLAVTASVAKEMVKAAKRYKKVFSVMHQMRTSPAVRKAKEIVKSGMLGELLRTLLIDTVFYRTQAYYDRAPWRATWKSEGGGILINQASHGIDIFISLCGLPKKVEAKTRAKLHKIETEDEVSAFLEYPGGAWGYYYTGTCEAGGALHLELIGNKSKLVLKGEELKVYTFKPAISEYMFKSKESWGAPEVKEKKIKLSRKKKDVIGYGGVIKNFARAVLYKEPLLSPAEDEINVISFINAMILSGRKGIPVRVPVSSKEYDSFINKLKKDGKVAKGLKTN